MLGGGQGGESSDLEGIRGASEEVWAGKPSCPRSFLVLLRIPNRSLPGCYGE